MSRMGFPCVGSWVTYGLGTENQNLPGFVAMYDTLGRGLPKGHASNWGSGFLPGIFQGTALNPQGAPIDNLLRDPHMNDEQQRRQLDLMRRLNRDHQQDHEADAELTARIESFELAYRMQMAAPEALDIGKEPESVRKMYGIDNPKCAHFAKQVLMARRLVERGVRFVQIFHGSNGGAGAWDAHSNLRAGHASLCNQVDQPIGGLLKDLKRRGLLDETIVVWGTEFGRTPGAQGGTGRDHHPYGFCVWLAGGGIKGGIAHGATDPLGFHAVENRHYITDLHATVLYQLGLDPRRLDIPGRKRLEIDYGRPIREIIA
jgi:hypothetical protein